MSSSGGTPAAEAARSGRGARTGFFGDLDEFFKRGTPRQSPMPGLTPRGFSLRRLEQQLAAWIQARGLPPLTARALTVSILDDTGILCTARGSGGDSHSEMGARGVILHEASIMLSGVEVLITISVPNLPGFSSARVFEPKLVEAQSHCGWPVAQQRLAAAVEVAKGRTLEDFLDALCRDGAPWGTNAASQGGMRSSASAPHLAPALAGFGTPSHMVLEEQSDSESALGSSSRSSCSTTPPQQDKPENLADALALIDRLRRERGGKKGSATGDRCRRRHSAGCANEVKRSDNDASDSDEEVLDTVLEHSQTFDPVPPDSNCWDWPLSRHEKKERILLLERQMNATDRRLLIKEIRRNSIVGCDSDSEPQHGEA